MAKSAYVALSVFLCLAIQARASATEIVDVGDRHVVVPDNFPSEGRAVLERLKQRVGAVLPGLPESARSKCQGAKPNVVTRPDQRLFAFAEENRTRWYSFSSRSLVGTGEVTADGHSWEITFRRDGSFVRYYESTGLATSDLTLHSTGMISRMVLFDGSSSAVVRCWTVDGLPTAEPGGGGRTPVKGNPESFRAFLAWRSSASEVLGPLVYFYPTLRQVVLRPFVRNDSPMSFSRRVLIPPRRRFECALSLGEDALSELEKASRGWTEGTSVDSYYLGRLLAFCQLDAARSASTRLRASDNEWLRLASLAGLAGHGMLKDDTQAEGVNIEILREYGKTGNALRPGTVLALAGAKRASMVALILGLRGDEQIVDEVVAQLRGDAKRLGHAGVLCDVLGDSKAQKAAPLLRDLLSDEGFQMPDCALRSLMRFGDKEAFPLAVERLQAMKERIDEKNLPSLCDLAAELEALTGEIYYDDASAWRIWWEANKATWSPPVCPEDMGRKDEKK